tara:strand:+ start:421 stop:618 length:198 start_codon:yes stop_codon:yes gene_type:complete
MPQHTGKFKPKKTVGMKRGGKVKKGMKKRTKKKGMKKRTKKAGGGMMQKRVMKRGGGMMNKKNMM